MNEKTKHNEGNQLDANTENTSSYNEPGESLRRGMICPRCHTATIIYNEMVDLFCPNCGLTEPGTYT